VDQRLPDFSSCGSLAAGKTFKKPEEKLTFFVKKPRLKYLESAFVFLSS
jgi:hypothetical protein